MKSLDGKPVQVGISGKEAKTVSIGHTVDLYYEVIPSVTDGESEGYITVKNVSQDGALLALTKLRTTNLTEKITTNGILPIMAEVAVMAVEQFALDLEEAQNKPTETPEVDVELSTFEKYQIQVGELFASVSKWLEE